jgi:hypothetical protein
MVLRFLEMIMLKRTILDHDPIELNGSGPESGSLAAVAVP